jgi:hypothetical protein
MRSAFKVTFPFSHLLLILGPEAVCRYQLPSSPAFITIRKKNRRKKLIFPNDFVHNTWILFLQIISLYVFQSKELLESYFLCCDSLTFPVGSLTFIQLIAQIVFPPEKLQKYHTLPRSDLGRCHAN